MPGVARLFTFRGISSNIMSGAGRRMPRYFPNTFEEFNPNTREGLDKENELRRISQCVSKLTAHQPSDFPVDGGLYVGVAGIAYSLYHISKNPLLVEKKEVYIKKAVEYINPCLGTKRDSSFLLGSAGIFALAAALFKKAGAPYDKYVKFYKQLYSTHLIHTSDNGDDELFVGRAGYLAGILWLTRELGEPVEPPERIHKICDYIFLSGKDYACKHNSPCPLMYEYYGTEYVGAAHGVSFILQMLLSVPDYLACNYNVAEDVKTTIDYLLSLQDAEGNWPACLGELHLKKHELVHWCHGAPGVIYLMAKAYLVYSDEKYKEACLKAGELVWKKGLLTKGPGICHGVSGNGYVFLLLYRLTNDQIHLYRAKRFADFMGCDEFKKARCPDNPLSLYEGLAGSLCFLSDLIYPDKAEFPFQDVFS